MLRVRNKAAFTLAALVALAACRRESAPAPSATRAPVASAAPDPGRLPEDPVAAKRSEAQWREHMAEEEHERQILFDRQHLKEHVAVIKLINDNRARYDGAKTEAAVAKVRATMPAKVAEIRKRVTAIDHWGTNSKLLPDYEALESMLLGPYAEAKIQALGGQGQVYEAIRTNFDEHLTTMSAWLKEASESEEEEQAAKNERDEH